MITNKQRDERKLGIGGSDMPIILGLSSYKTAYQLYLEKTGIVEPEDDMTEIQYWGTQLEDVIRQEFAKRNKVEVTTCDTIVHPFYEFLRANVDGLIPSLNAVLEIKCSSSYMKDLWGEEGSEIIPLTYLVQVAHYCAVTNSDCAYIAVLIGGNEYRQFKYARDLELEKMVTDEARKFWECVETKIPPPPSTIPDLRLMFPRHREEKKIAANDEINQQIQTLAKTKYQIKELNEVEEQYKFNIMQFMGDAECLTDGEGKPIVSWKANKRGSRTFLMKGTINE